jgi:hypothetical protein
MKPTYQPSNIISLTDFRGAFDPDKSIKDFENVFESLTTNFHVTIRQLEKFSSNIDDVAKLEFLNEVITALRFFDFRSAEQPAGSLPGIGLIETAVELCEKSAEAEFFFEEKQLALHLRKLSEACYDAHYVLPERWKDNRGHSIPLPSVAEAMAA